MLARTGKCGWVVLAVLAFGCSDDTVAPPRDSGAQDRGAGDRAVTDRGPGDRGGDKAAGDQGAADKKVTDGPVVGQPVELKTVLSGGQETPAVTTSASGTAKLTVNGAKTQIEVEVTFSGLSGAATGAHLHVGELRKSGPIIFPLMATGITSPIKKTLTASDLQPQAAQGVSTFADAVAAILGGKAYVNLHTGANPGGEIRGQLGEVLINAPLSGANEVPPVTTSAQGAAKLTVNRDQSEVTFEVTFSGLMGTFSGAHLHVGAAGAAGPIVFPLATAGATSPIQKTVKLGDLQPQPTQGISTFADAVRCIFDGACYVNVHSSANPGGEIRAQTIPAP